MRRLFAILLILATVAGVSTVSTAEKVVKSEVTASQKLCGEWYYTGQIVLMPNGLLGEKWERVCTSHHWIWYETEIRPIVV